MTDSTFTQRLLWLGAIVAGVVLLDQSIKRFMVDWIGPAAAQHRVEVLGSWAGFEYLENRGAAFGLFSQGTTLLAVISVIIILVAFGAMVYYARHEFWLALGIALIIGGAIGNAIDRFVRGYVVDYIALGRFWKFNLADSAVSIGVVITFICLWIVENKSNHHDSIQESTQ